MRPATKIFRLAVNDLRLTVRDRASLFWMIVLPVAFIWFFGQMGGGSSRDLRISLQWENQDDGWLSRALLEELDAPPLELREAASGGEDRVRTLVIPKGFTAGVLAGEQQTLKFISEPGANVRYGVAAQMHIVRVLTRFVARLVELELGGSTEHGAEELAALAERPPRVSLAVATAGRGRPVPSGYAQSAPGTLTMIVLMMTLIYGGVFLAQEKQSGMLRRQATLPITRRQIFYGKLLGRMLVAAVQIALLLAFGRFLFGLSWGGSPVGLALVLGSYTLAVAGLATLLGAVVETPEQASGIGWISSMVLAALGGCWWPSEIMPAWLQQAAHAFPTTWAMDGFHALISFGRGAEAALLPSAVLLAMGLLFTSLGARFLRLG
ncbi:MAG: ABC transporter permease [Acidobacteria bacterium]|nr:ABC transporter permease [Acidobacteriota bacterium]